jgi:outer membrane protein
MTGAIRIWAAAFIAALTIARADAADLTPTPEPPLPPPPPIFFVHVGALGVFPFTNAQTTGGGFFNSVTPLGVGIANAAIRPNYTLGLEAGYFVTPNWAISLAAGVPPIARIKATGLTATSLLGTNLLGSVRYGPAALLLQYHFTQFGALQPYFGLGAVYLLNFGNISDGVLSNFQVDQNFGFVVQGGVDLMLTPNWGVFVDAKKVFLSTDVFGFLLNTSIPIRTHVALDPWAAVAGVTFKY